IRDAPESLGLALGAVNAARAIEPGQRLVRLRIAVGGGLEREGLPGRASDAEPRVGARIVAGTQLSAVEVESLKLEHLPVEPQGARTARVGRVGLDLEPGAHPRAGWVQRYVEMDGINQVVGRSVVLEQNGARRVGFHRWHSGALAFIRQMAGFPSLSLP